MILKEVYALYPKSKTRISLKLFFTSNCERSCNLNAKTASQRSRYAFRRKKRKFHRFPSFQFCPTPKIENLEISESILLRQKIKGQDMLLKEKKNPRFPSFRFCPTPKIENSKILESVLLLQILRVNVIYDSETTKINWGKNLKVKMSFLKKKKFRGFQVFDFALHPKSKTQKYWKAFFHFKF